jgi:hypothetical protein
MEPPSGWEVTRLPASPDMQALKAYLKEKKIEEDDYTIIVQHTPSHLSQKVN